MHGNGDGALLELDVTEIDDPLPGATFGSIGRYVEACLRDPGDGPPVPRRLEIGFEAHQAQHVDTDTLTVFRVDVERREFTPVESSVVDVAGRLVTAWVTESGTYGLIGLPRHAGILETLVLLDRFEARLLEERERGSRELLDRICGLILCADPSAWGELPPGLDDVCTICRGLDIGYGRLPERYLWEREPRLRPLHATVADEPGATPAVLGWGWNAWGELGDGTTTQRPTPAWVATGLVAKKIVGGGVGDFGDWTLALATDGSVWSWGDNRAGQLGIGLFAARTTPTRVGVLSDVVDVAAGPDHGLAAGSDGSLWRWGRPHSPGGNPDRLPVRVFGVSDIVAVAAGHSFSLALRRDGRVFAWGDNSLGQLGDGSAMFRATPTEVPGLTAIRAIAAGSGSSFAIRSNGAVVAWGAGGTLGDGATANRLSPVAVPGLADVEQISVGYSALARTTGGEVWFWGQSFYGESGDGTGTGVHLTPVRVPGLQQVTAIAQGGSHCLAMRSDGSIWAWGSGIVGEIGITPVYTQPSPIQVPLPGARRASGVGSGERSSFAILG